MFCIYYVFLPGQIPPICSIATHSQIFSQIIPTILFQTHVVALRVASYRRGLVDIEKKPMNDQLALADNYRIGLEKNYDVEILPKYSNIAKKETPVQTSIKSEFNPEHEQKLGVECSQVETNQKDQESKEDDAKSKASGIPKPWKPNQDIFQKLQLEHKQKLEDKCAQLEENLKNQGLKVSWYNLFCIYYVFLLYNNNHIHKSCHFISDS